MVIFISIKIVKNFRWLLLKASSPPPSRHIIKLFKVNVTPIFYWKKWKVSWKWQLAILEAYEWVYRDKDYVKVRSGNANTNNKYCRGCCCALGCMLIFCSDQFLLFVCLCFFFDSSEYLTSQPNISYPTHKYIHTPQLIHHSIVIIKSLDQLLSMHFKSRLFSITIKKQYMVLWC